MFHTILLSNSMKDPTSDRRLNIEEGFVKCQNYLLAIAKRELDRVLQSKFGPADLVQSTYLKAKHHLGDFAGSTMEDLRRWLRKILINHLRDLRRAFIKSRNRSVRREIQMDSIDTLQRPLKDHRQTACQLVIADESKRLLKRALSQLPPRQRRLLKLRYQERYSFVDAGNELGIGSAAARQLRARAIHNLQKILEAMPSII